MSGRPSATASTSPLHTDVAAEVVPDTVAVASSGERSPKDIVAGVLDPEVPVVTIADLGILRRVEQRADGHVAVEITPTYSGCPAMDTIRTDILTALDRAGYPDASVAFVLAPAWTTDWISQDGRRKLREFGIAPPEPVRSRSRQGPVALSLTVRCTQCGSADTRELSHFGSTACKSLWACNSCREPFDHFKAH